MALKNPDLGGLAQTIQIQEDAQILLQPII